MAKRIYSERVKKYGIATGVIGIPLSILAIFFLASLGALDITGYSYDEICTGSEIAPCNVYINISVNEDIFIYPSNNWSNTPFKTNPHPENVKMYRSWGKSWREIKLNQSCTGTWCGLSNSKDVRKFSFAFREGRNYQLKFEIIKSDPKEDISWSFG